MTRSTLLLSALLCALGLIPGRPVAAGVANRIAATVPGAEAGSSRPARDPARIAQWGITARVVTGKIPTITVRIEADKVLKAWPQIRAAGIASGDAAWAQAHPLTACEQATLGALPVLLHELYHNDSDLDYVPVYAEAALGAGSTAQPFFTTNVNRVLVRKMPPSSGFTRHIALSTWAEAQMRQEHP